MIVGGWICLALALLSMSCLWGALLLDIRRGHRAFLRMAGTSELKSRA